MKAVKSGMRVAGIKHICKLDPRASSSAASCQAYNMPVLGNMKLVFSCLILNCRASSAASVRNTSPPSVFLSDSAEAPYADWQAMEVGNCADYASPASL